MSFCDQIWTIPTFNQQYSSLNLAQAVQVVAYQWAQLFSSQPHNQPLVTEKKSSASVNLKGLLEVVNQISLHPLYRKFLDKSTAQQTQNRLLSMMKSSIHNESDLKFMVGFLRASYLIAQNSVDFHDE